MDADWLQNGTYHVICRGNNRGAVFNCPADREMFLGIVRMVMEGWPFALHHYVLMTNHVHLLLTPGKSGVLPEIMRHIDLRYSRAHQRAYGNSGHLWQGRYKRFLVTNDAYFLTCAAYIELNPVRAAMVSNPEEHPWSSYRSYAFGEQNALVDPNPVFLGLGRSDEERRFEYMEIVNMWRTYPVNRRTARRFFKDEPKVLHPSAS